MGGWVTLTIRYSHTPTQASMQQLQAGMQQLQAGMQQMQAGQQQMQAGQQQLLAQQHNLQASLRNANRTKDTDVLVPLMREAPGPNQGQLPPNGVHFPGTVGAVYDLTHAQLDALGAFYGTQAFAEGRLPMRCRRFHEFIKT